MVSVDAVLRPGAANALFGVCAAELAGYNFGNNRGSRKFDMTATVTQAAASVQPDMTDPATQSLAPGGSVVRFVLPSGTTLATAPEPVDPRVHCRKCRAAMSR